MLRDFLFVSDIQIIKHDKVGSVAPFKTGKYFKEINDLVREVEFYQPGVYETVEQLGCLLYLHLDLLTLLPLILGLNVQDGLQALFVVRDQLRKPREVEALLDVFLRNMTEELVTSVATEPVDPGNILG